MTTSTSRDSGGTFYRHSGRAPIAGLFFTLILGGIAAVVLGFVYAYVLAYIPIAGYVTFVISAGFGLLVGLATGYGLTHGKVRNDAASIVVGLLVALLAQYVGWAVWVHAVLGRADVDVPLAALVFSPAALGRTIRELNEIGAWSIAGFTPTGAVLWCLWAVEALIVTATATIVASNAASSPFCERCDAWTEKSEGVLATAPSDEADVRERLVGRRFAELSTLGPRPTDPNVPFLRFDLHHCPSCSTMHALDALAVTETLEDGKTKQETKTIVAALLLSPDEAATVRGVAGTLVPVAPAPTSSADADADAA